MTRLLVLVAVLPVLAGCFGPDAAPVGYCGDDDANAAGNPYAWLHTNFGSFAVQLYHDKVPLTVENFIALAESGYYNDTMFHRMKLDFMMQGGDPTGTGGGGDSATGEPVLDEHHPDIRHNQRGIISMANRGPDTTRSQFFVMFGVSSSLNGRYNAFGLAAEGNDTLAAINFGAASTIDGPPIINTTLHGVTVTCDDPRAGLRANFLTPSLWSVRNETETNAFWVKNGGAAQTVDWSIEAADGPLPPSWVFEFDAPSHPIDAGTPDDPAYTWQTVTVQVPNGTEPGDHPLVLRGGSVEQPFILRVAPTFERVARIGDLVTLSFDLRTTDRNEDLGDGSVSLIIGEQNVPPGFELGALGMAARQSMVLHVPAPMWQGLVFPQGVDESEVAGEPLDIRASVRFTQRT